MKVVTVNYNNTHFTLNLFKSLLDSASEDFTFIVCDNGSSGNYLTTLLDNQSSKFKVVHNKQTRYGSYAHGEGLNKCLSVLDSNDIFLLIDNDCFMLLDKWDAVFKKIVTPDSYVCTHTKHNENVPGAFLLCAHAKLLLDNKISFLPDIQKDGSAKKNRDVGYDLGRLSNWTKLNHRKYTRTLLGSVGYEMRFLDDTPIAAHFSHGRGSDIDNPRVVQWMKECKNARKNNIRSHYTNI